MTSQPTDKPNSPHRRKHPEGPEANEALTIRVADLASGSRNIHHVLTKEQMGEALDGVEGYRPGGELRVELALNAMTDGFYVAGTLDGRIRGECGRCLQHYDEDLEASVTSTFVPRPDFSGHDDEEIELTDDDVQLCFYDGDSVDLLPFIRESVLLELSGYPLCQEECKGLCPECGKNLNKGSCECDVIDVDPRFADLLALRAKQEKQNTN